MKSILRIDKMKILLAIIFFTIYGFCENTYYKICTVATPAKIQRVFIVKNSHINNSYDGIRFYTSNKDTLLNYWIDSINGDTAKAWVNLNSYKQVGYLFTMWYGDTSLKNSSNIYTAFGRYQGTSFSLGKNYDVNRNCGYDDTISNVSGNYEAWPSINWSLNKKKLYAMYRSTKGTATHGYDSSGYIAMRISSDSGASWGSEIVVADSAGFDDRDISFIVYNNNGIENIRVFYVVCLYNGDSCNIVTKTTNDTCVTWSGFQQIGFNNKLSELRGRPHFLSNGRLILPTYTYASGEYSKAYMFYSNDTGTTWGYHLIATSTATYTFSEHSIIELKTNGAYAGSMVTIIRNEAVGTGANYYKCASTDYGSTWSEPVRLTGFPTDGASPVELMRTIDDKILLLYGKGYGRVYESKDECVTWDSLAYFITSAASSAGRLYPSIVEVDTSRYIIAWCTNGNPGNSDVYLQYYSNNAFYQVYTTTDYPATRTRPDFNGDTLYETYGAAVRRMTSNYWKTASNDSIIYTMRVKHNYCLTSGFRNGDQNAIGFRGDAVNRFVATTLNDAWYSDFTNIPIEAQWVIIKIKRTNHDVWVYENDIEKLHKTISDGSGISDLQMGPSYYVTTNAASYFYQDYGYIRDYTQTIPMVSVSAEYSTTTSNVFVKRTFKHGFKNYREGFKNF